jgi:hypothetical protein
MKKQICIILLGAALALSLGSCKKEYTCTCYAGTAVDWTGQIQATSASAATKQAETDTGDNCSCN